MVVISVFWPERLSRISLSLEIGILVYMVDRKAALRQWSIISVCLTVLDQQILACWESFIDLVHSRVCGILIRGGLDIVDSFQGRRCCCPAELQSAPCGQVRWKILRTVETPRVGHQTIASDSIASPIDVVQVGKTKEMTSFVSNHSDPTDT